MLLCAASRPGWPQKNTLKIHFTGAAVQISTPLRMSYWCRSLSEKCSAFFLMRGLAAHTSAFSELKHSLGLHWWSISCLVAQTKAYCFVANLMACGKAAKLGPDDRDRGWEEGEEESAISTFSNHDTKWRHGLPGCAEWYYLFGVEWKGRRLMIQAVKDNSIISLSMWIWKANNSQRSENSFECFWVKYSRGAKEITFHQQHIKWHKGLEKLSNNTAARALFHIIVACNWEFAMFFIHFFFVWITLK